MTRIRFALVVACLVAALGTGGAQAHKGWAISGSFVASAQKGGASATVFAYQQVTDRTDGPVCSPDAEIPDGLDASVAALPTDQGLERGGHRARITWESAAGPVNTLLVQWLTPAVGTCAFMPTEVSVAFDNPNFPPLGQGSGTVTIPAPARLIVVNADAAALVSWTLEGIDD